MSEKRTVTISGPKPLQPREVDAVVAVDWPEYQELLRKAAAYDAGVPMWAAVFDREPRSLSCLWETPQSARAMLGELKGTVVPVRIVEVTE